MATILSFPDPNTPAIPIRTSTATNQAALHRPHLGPRLVHRLPHPNHHTQSYKVVSQLDLEIARRSNRIRLRHVFNPSSYGDDPPPTAA